MTLEERYEDALRQIINILGPYGMDYFHGAHDCVGCQFEWGEALVLAMNVLCGLDANAHYGPAHTREQSAVCSSTPGGCQMCRDDPNLKWDELRAIWQSNGFKVADDAS